MATPRETLFQRLGIKTADEIRADRNERQQAFLRSQQDPFAKSGAAIGVGLKRLFGKPSEEELRAQQADEIITDVMSSYNAAGDDAPTLEQAYQGIMQRLGAAGLGEEAMNMGQLLNEYGATQIEKARQAQADQATIDRANIVNVRDIVGYKPEYKLNPITQQYEEVGQVPVYGDVAYDRRTNERVIDRGIQGGGSVTTELDTPAPTYTQVGSVKNYGTPVARDPATGNYHILLGDGTLGMVIKDMSRIVLGNEDTSFASPAADALTGGRGNVGGAGVRSRGGQMARNNRTPAPAPTPTQQRMLSGEARRQRRSQ